MPSTLDTRGLQIIDPVLTNLALNYRSKGFIYDQVVSSMSVAQNAGQYPVWSLDDFMRDDVDAAVADRAVTPEINVAYSLEDYLLKNYRLKVSITNEERSQAHEALRLEQTKLQALLDRFAVIRERRLAAALQKTTNGGQLTLGAAASVKWDAAGGTNVVIEQDIATARKAVYDATGQMVDSMIIPWDVAYVVALDPTIREIIKYTVDGRDILELGDRVLPRTLHGLNVIIATPKYNSAKEGAATALQSIWGDSVRLIKRAPDNAWGTPATVYALRGTVNGQTPGHLLVDRWEDKDPPVEYIRAWEKVQEKVVAPDVAYEISDVLT